MFEKTQLQETPVSTTAAHTEVRISPMGVVQMEGKNFTGDACSVLSEKLRAALGGGGDTDLKPEFFQTTVEDQTVTNW